MKRKITILFTFIISLSMLLGTLSNVFAQDDLFVGGVYNVPMGSDALTLSPLTWGTVYEWEIIDHVYDSLVRYDVDNQPVPVLCESYTYNSTYEKWTFNLRDNAFWHDGTPVTVDDFVYTFVLLWNDPALPRRDWLFDDIYSITGIDATTFQIEFTWGPKPADVLIGIATQYILPKHIWEDVADVYTYTNEDPIGCGPMKLVEWSHGAFFRFERHADYHLDGPWIREKVIKIVRSTETAFYGLQTGELEVVGGVEPELETVGLLDPDIRSHVYLMDYWLYLGMNHRRYPNNITEFRQAVMYGMNRSAVVDIARYGRGIVAPASGALPYGPYYNPDIPQYEYNPTLAESMLDDLGFVDSDADGVREDGLGNPLEFDFLAAAEYQQSYDGAVIMSQGLADIGIDVTVKAVIWDVMWNAIGGPGGSYPGKYDYDWTYTGWVGFWSDRHPNWALWLYNKDLWWGSDDCNIPGWSGYWRDLVSNMTDDISYETDEAIVKTDLDEVQLILATELPYLPINFLGGSVLYRIDKFAGWIMGNTTGPDNWQTLLNLHLIEPEEGAPGFTVLVATVSLVSIAGYLILRKKRR